MPTSLEDLPAELLSLIADFLVSMDDDHRELSWRERIESKKRMTIFDLRLVSKQVESSIRHTFARRHFRIQTIELSYRSLNRIVEISKNEIFSTAVKELVLPSRQISPHEIDSMHTHDEAIDEKELKQQLQQAMIEERHIKTIGAARDLLTEALRGLPNCKAINVLERFRTQNGLHLRHPHLRRVSVFDKALWLIAKQSILDSGLKPEFFSALVTEYKTALDPTDLYIPAHLQSKFCDAFSQLKVLHINLFFDPCDIATADKNLNHYLPNFLNAIPSITDLHLSVSCEYNMPLGKTIMNTALDNIKLPNLAELNIRESCMESKSFVHFIESHQATLKSVFLELVGFDWWIMALDAIKSIPNLNRVEIFRSDEFLEQSEWVFHSDVELALEQGWTGNIHPGADQPSEALIDLVLMFFEDGFDIDELNTEEQYILEEFGIIECPHMHDYYDSDDYLEPDWDEEDYDYDSELERLAEDYDPDFDDLESEYDAIPDPADAHESDGAPREGRSTPHDD